MALKYSVLNTLSTLSTESVARDDLGFNLVELKCFMTLKKTQKEASNYALLSFPTPLQST